MPITASCPGCKALFRLPEELAGKSVRCQKCERLFVVSHLGMAAEPAAVVAPPAPQLPAPAIEAPAPAIEEPLVVMPRPAVKFEPERPPSRRWLLALIASFLLMLALTGGGALLWVATHLAAPTSVMIVPPFRGNNRDDGGQHFHRRIEPQPQRDELPDR